MDKFRASSSDHIISDRLLMITRSWRSRKVLTHLWSLCASVFRNKMWFSRKRKRLMKAITSGRDTGMLVAKGSFSAKGRRRARSCQLLRPQDRSLIPARTTIWNAITRRNKIVTFGSSYLCTKYQLRKKSIVKLASHKRQIVEGICAYKTTELNHFAYKSFSYICMPEAFPVILASNLYNVQHWKHKYMHVRRYRTDTHANCSFLLF